MTKTNKQSALDNFTTEQIKGAHRELFEELFNDHYRYRGRIYFVNFVRGIFFGFGSVLGATLVVSLLIWLLSLFSDAPLVNGLFESIRGSITSPR